MYGLLIAIPAENNKPVISGVYNGEVPTVHDVIAIVGGVPDIVPGYDFHTLPDGNVMKGIAFTNDDEDALDMNSRASTDWYASCGHVGMEEPEDWLQGRVAFLTGDAEFMEAFKAQPQFHGIDVMPMTGHDPIPAEARNDLKHAASV